MPGFPAADLRRQFPALEHAGDFIFFDNAAGAQVPARVVAAVTDHLIARNVQRGGPYRQSREVDAMIARARAKVASFVNARGADEIAFGLNATSFIRAISLAVGQTLAERPDIIVSDLDHEANIATWLALERAGARIVWWRVRDDGRLHPVDLDALLTERTRIVACTVAANATGTVVDAADVAKRAHRVGADVFLDAVHYAPHGPLDVQALDCDYLVCSGYKIFGPHMGFAWCRRESINRLPMFREHFIPDVTPDKLEAGTYVYENVAGMAAALEYLNDLGESCTDSYVARNVSSASGDIRSASDEAEANPSGHLRRAMTAIANYERTLSSGMLDAIESIPGATIHGVADRARLDERVPTMCFSVEGVNSSAIADGLAFRNIGARSGHMYTPRLMERFGLLPNGVVRASLVHYNTTTEIARFREALRDIVKGERT